MDQIKIVMSSYFGIDKLIVDTNMQTFGLMLMVCAVFPLQWYYMTILGMVFVFASPHFDHPVIKRTWDKGELMNLFGDKFQKLGFVKFEEMMVDDEPPALFFEIIPPNVVLDKKEKIE